MLNREQRRAQLKKLSKKVPGIDITKGTIDIPIKGKNDKLTLDLMNFDTIYHFSEMCDKFSDVKAAYPVEYADVEEEKDENKKRIKLVRLVKRIITDFTVHVDAVFGDGATIKVFGNTAPVPQTIGEFIEDMSQVLTSLSSLMSSELESGNGNNVLSVASAATAAAGREGNA